MRRGCCIGSLLLLAGGLAGIFASGYYIGKLGVLVLAPRADTAGALQDGAVLLVRLDTAGDEMYRLLQLGSGGLPSSLLSTVLPYEAALALRPEADQGTVGVAGAVSLRRMAGVIFSRWSQRMSVGPAQSGHSTLDRPEEGLLVYRSSVPLPAYVRTDQVSNAPTTPMFEGGHHLELLLDNRTGAGRLALAPWLPGGDADITREMTAQLDAALTHTVAVHAVGDFLSDRTLHLRITVETKNEQESQVCLLFLSLLEDTATQTAFGHDMTVEGNWDSRGKQLEGEFIIRGYDGLIEGYLRGLLA